MDLAKAYVQIIPSAEGIKEKLSKTLGDETGNSGKSAGITFAKKMIGAISVAAIGKKVVEGISASIKAGAALEQSIGGIETLFKDSADTMIKYANNAFETAGMSANDYMETATGFAASLLQGLGGDTAKAAEISNMAITDMSDNANKMGTDMESIQNAYQGFAKQNYTMLDNLKLGYGGTKSEMERLLKDAEKISGVHYDLSNLSDVYSAIHVIQGELDITGTTAKEAATTISGSLNMTKAAWENVLAVMSTGGDIKTAMSNLASSAATFLFDNLIPAIGNIIVQLPSAIGSFIQTAIPILMEQGGEILSSIKDGFFNKLPEMLDNAPKMIDQFVERLDEKLSNMEESGGQMISKVGQGILKNFPVVMTIIGRLIGTILLAIAKIFPRLIQYGLTMLGKLAAGMIKGIPQLIAQIPTIFRNIKSSFAGVDWKSIGKNIIMGIANGIKNFAGEIVKAAKDAAHRAFESAKNFLGIHSPSTLFENQIGKMIDMGMAAGITKNAKVVTDSMKDISSETVDAAQINAGSYSQPSAKAAGRSLLEIDYDRLGKAMAYAVADAGITVKIGERDLGRIVRGAFA